MANFATIVAYTVTGVRRDPCFGKHRPLLNIAGERILNFLVIIVGYRLAPGGAKLWQAGHAAGGQGTGSSLLTFTLLVSGFCLMIWGAIRIFL